MESTETQALIRICQPRFRSFSGATETVLGVLTDVVPGLLVLGQTEADQRTCRAIDVQGGGVGGVEKGTILPQSDSELDRELVASLGAESSICIPLEMSDGRIVGMLCALHTRPGAYRCEHIAMLGIAARLLGYEWESVERRAELRRLRGRLPEAAGVDRETGILNRDGFLGLLDHDWRLAERGTVESVVVALRVSGHSDRASDGAAMGKLALKIAAEVLEATARTTDRVGRIGETTLAATLVGAGAEQAPAFVERFRAALGRVTRDGNPRIALSHGVRALAGTSSPTEALGLADAEAARPNEVSREPAYQGAQE